LSRELDEIVRIASEACVIIRKHYATAFKVDFKIGDDPVTAADREANTFICAELERAFPGVPIVAEENDPSTFDVRKGAAECFFVDPLDGTREFVARNGEFAVMIGLARDKRAALGVVAAPVTDRIHAGGPGEPSFEMARDGSRRAITPSKVSTFAGAHAVVSRSRATEEAFAMLARMGVTRVDKLGSAGLKAAVVACGEADMWLQPSGGGKLWDTCGPEAVAVGAGASFGSRGGAVIDYSDGPLELDGIIVASTDALFRIAAASMKL
jgi:3'(2'), 5'-bisphosphate nucleotidase